MFKLTGKHNNSTLHQQNMGIYTAGRWLAITIFIVGTILSLFFLSTWLANAVQDIITGLFKLFTLNVSGAMKTGMSLFTFDAFIHNQYAISQIQFLGITFFLNHGKMIGGALKILFLILCEFGTWKLTSMIWVKYRNINHHEHGNGKFESPDNIKKETQPIPDRGFRYDEPSGAIMMHEYNFRGEINDIVASQLGMLKSFFNIDKSHDPTGWNFRHFYMWFKIVVFSIVLLFLSSSALGGAKYSTTSSNQSTNIAWYNPFYLFLILWRILHFILLGIWELIKAFFSMNTTLFSAPLYLSYTIGLAEIILVGLYIYHVTHKISLSAKYNTLPFSQYFHVQTKADKDEKKSDRNKKRKLRQKNINHFKRRWREFIAPTSNTYKDELTKEITQKEQGHEHKIEFYSQHPRLFLCHNWVYVHAHAKHPFWSHPLLATKMATLQTCKNLLPLDKGITGWYYLTSGNGALQNLLLYGITRSGKGQMIVNTITDINSRASHRYQKNMIFNDSKGELAASTFRVLKRRGYDVKVLNIMDMAHSMSYNPLIMVIRQARAGAVSEATKSCSQLSFTIYNPAGQGQNAFFYTEAASLFDSIAFAQIAFAHARYYGLNDYKTDKDGKTVHDDGKARGHDKNDGDYWKDKNGIVHSELNAWSRVTINNILQMTVQLGGEQAQIGDDEMNQSNQLMIYFEHLQNILNKLRENEDSNTSEVMQDHISILSQAVSEFQNSKMAGSKTAGSIYSTFLDRLRIYQQQGVAKMTSMNNYDAEEMGFDRLFTIQFSRQFKLQTLQAVLYGSKPDANGNPVINTHDKIESHNTHLSEIGIAKIPFDSEIHDQTFFIALRIHDERTSQTGTNFDFIIRCHKHFYQPKEYKIIKGDYRRAPQVADLKIIKRNGHEQVINSYTAQPELRRIDLSVEKKPAPEEYKGLRGGVSKLARRNVQVVRQMHFLYNPRPTALFLVTPPNQPELNQLCTFVINQTFNMLSSFSLKITKGRHVQRSLQFILDEMGNIPPIPNMSTKVSIGLSQHIEFLMVFQNYEQIVHNYHKDAQSIISNCSTIYFILSSSSQTIQSISKACGNRTIYNRGRNADPTKIANANYNASTMAQPVITQDQLRQLKPGDMIIIRTNDRSTRWGKATIPYPIFDTGKYKLPYSFTFLKKYESGDSLSSLPVVTPHKYLKVESVTLHFVDIYDWLESKNPIDTKHMQKKQTDLQRAIKNSGLPSTFTNKYMTILNTATGLAQKNSDPSYTSKGIAQIKKFLKVDKKLFKFRKVSQVCQYMLTVITSQPNSIQTLEDLPTDRDGDNIFDMLSDEEQYILEYNESARQNLKKTLKTKSKMKSAAPQLFSSDDSQVLFGLADMINQYKPIAPTRSGKPTMQSTTEQQDWCLAKLNEFTNDFLAKIGLITGDTDNGYQLTSMAKDFLDNEQDKLQTFFKVNKFDYKPIKPYPEIIAPLFNCLRWVSQHPMYNQFYGMLLLIKIVNLNEYKAFCTWQEPKTDKYGTPLKPHGKPEYQEAGLGLTPMSYIMALIMLMDMICKHPDFSDEQNKQTFKVPKLCATFIKQLAHIDDFSDSLFTD